MAALALNLEAQSAPWQVDQPRPPLLCPQLAAQASSSRRRSATNVPLAVSLSRDIIVLFHRIGASTLIASQVAGVEPLGVGALREDTRALNWAAARGRSAQRPTACQCLSVTRSTRHSRLLGIVVLAPRATGVDVEVFALKGLIASRAGETRSVPLALELPVVGRDHPRLDQLVAPPTRG